ncbi:LysR substrate-binding domain-containing protein [Microbulbifer bruguierae]|uniref:LysR substrate-binding domain-containing protein n=1 Tax=Microbulbifer bruguierae TaxID=3029061 RepID=A0ABY8NH02_9GAMM|nr:LysR family transcriptional regulator [Microbulbifer bruguierae]WGL17877.1 LysR substrate-binding domain-containing protein [Microbulbifer bruguierae]
MDRIDALNAFVAVADEGGFNKAADKLELSNQLVSKYVSQLEEHLKVRLFNRTTRRVHLTQEGEQCYQFARQILESLADMKSQLGEMQSEAQGLLRISAPVTFATRHLAPLIGEFKKEHPAVGIDLQLNDRKVDVVEEGFDVALRIGKLKSSSLIARRLAPIRLVVCASPEYLQRHGVPQVPEDLKPEHYLRYSYLESSSGDSRLMTALKRNRLMSAATSISCNNGEILMQAAIAGEGYALQPTFIVGEAIKAGKLNVILPEFAPETLGIYAVYPHRNLLATKLRVFIDFISSYFGDPPYWDAFD